MVFDFQRDSNDLKIKIISFLNEKYNLLHVDRANPDLIENIKVSVYGLEQDIKNISKVSVIDNITLKINPFDKNTTSNIVSSITNNELGLNVNVVGNEILVTFPILTEERRFKIDKIAKENLENAKISLRVGRENILKNLNELQKQDTSISEDIIKRYKSDLDKFTKEISLELDTLYK